MAEIVYEVWQHQIVSIPDADSQPVIVDAGRLLSRHRDLKPAIRAAKRAARGCLMDGPSTLGCVREASRRDWYAKLRAVTRKTRTSIDIGLRPVRVGQAVTVQDAGETSAPAGGEA